MKNFLWLLLAFPLFSAFDYEKKNSNTGIGKVVADSLPVCLRQQIEREGKETPFNRPLRVDEYSYKGRTVYLYIMGCCDRKNPLYDDSCRRICAPSGGFTGNGDGQCPDFEKEAQLVKTVWTRPGKR